MNKTGKKKIWFNLEEFKSQLVTDIRLVKDDEENYYSVKILHPNTKEFIRGKDVPVSKLKNPSSPWDELARLGEELKAGVNIETEIQKCVAMPVTSSKKGKIDVTKIANTKDR